jgi:hypothetical protein
VTAHPEVNQGHLLSSKALHLVPHPLKHAVEPQVACDLAHTFLCFCFQLMKLASSGYLHQHLTYPAFLPEIPTKFDTPVACAGNDTKFPKGLGNRAVCTGLPAVNGVHFRLAPQISEVK